MGEYDIIYFSGSGFTQHACFHSIEKNKYIAFIPSANYKTIYFTDFLLKFQMQEVCTVNDYNYKKKDLHELKKASHIKYISTPKKLENFKIFFARSVCSPRSPVGFEPAPSHLYTLFLAAWYYT